MAYAPIKSSRKRGSLGGAIMLAGAVTFVAAIYLLASHSAQGIGFPLDDSWIHQTYARNLALRGEWAFRAGLPSAGSTSPLWSTLLAAGFLLRLSPYLWTFFLGAATLFGLAWLCEWAVRSLIQSYRPRVPWVGILFALEWHFAWAALSGMETLLHALTLTLVLVLLMTQSRRYLMMGLLSGLSVWIRPDGLTLVAPVALAILLTEDTLRAKSSAFGRYLLGFGSLFVFYLFFNLAIAGTPMPNTFYAKQAEYAAVMRSTPLAITLRDVALQLLVGPSLLLLPASLAWGIKAAREKSWGSLSALIWGLGYVIMYAARLPAYQHGRYLMPAMPILFLCGTLALVEFDGGRAFKRYHWIAQLVWRAGVAMLTAAFVLLGANSYAGDVAVIESEMVVTAKWAAQNLPEEAVIAAHDIGALGYFDNHALLDLAGLVSPEVIPFIRDEARLAEYLDRSGADYLIAFPNFYPALTAEAEPVFTTGSAAARNFNQPNMIIYRWKRP